MTYRIMIGRTLWAFPDLKSLMAKATPLRSGDMLAGLAAESEEERAVAADEEDPDELDDIEPDPDDEDL